MASAAGGNVSAAVVEVRSRGADLLRQPMLNKGTAFTAEEREQFGLTGLLPHAVSTLAEQAERAYRNVARKPTALERYIGMAALQDRNEHLYYRVLADHLEELLPVVYTPTVGEACAEFSHIFRRGRGVWITPEHRGRIASVLRHQPRGVRLVVVTDNERILGLGDLGAGGMGIPVGKLAIYVAAAGVHPASTLPVSLDVGTDNEELLADDLYLGWRAPRLRGAEYESLVDEFVAAVKATFPNVVLQWEDFKKANAFHLLERHRRTLPSFNDDIQGTAAVVLAGILSSERVTGRRLSDERIAILGGGAAGVGIAQLLRIALLKQERNVEDTLRAIAVIDSRGLLVDDTFIADAHKRPFAWPAELAARHGLSGGRRGLLDVVNAFEPTVLVGASGQPGVFDEAVIRAVAARVQRPVVLPLSNPTSKSEAVPADVLEWTGGRALVATGSPFDPVTRGGRQTRIGQANNAFVFPGLGLGTLVGRAHMVTDSMFLAAAEALALAVTADDLEAGSLYPRIRDLRAVTARVAEAVVREAREACVGLPYENSAIPGAVSRFMWDPAYPELVPADERDPARAAASPLPAHFE
jgi:malate dehydrogenase (oxaloacetate-decarboxylating)